MAANKKKDHKSIKLLTKIRSVLSFNIGTIIFGAIFLYMGVTLLMYLTSNDISTYQVVSGPLAKNKNYTGLVIRDEEVITADSAGYVTYYARDNAKVKKNGIVYSIGESKTNSVSMELTDSALDSIRRKISSFTSTYNPTDYNDIYSFKYELEGSLLSHAGVSTAGNKNATLGNQTLCAAVDDGIVMYSMDGYEDYDISTLRESDINKKSYDLQKLKTEKKVAAGDPIYKIIKSEEWSLCIPLTANEVIQLSDRSTIRVKFLKDNVTQIAKFVIHTNQDGTYWGELKFDSGMIRYTSDRYLEIELVTNSQSGLKIPISSVVQKDFYIIPEAFLTKSGNSSGFMIERVNDKEGEGPVMEYLTIYEHSNGHYYVDTNDVSEGDIVTMPESTNRYIIGKTESLQGVYCINKGYAQFRKIILVDKNDEYCIVETGTSYGLSQFDHIVYDSSSVNEQQILY